MTYSVEPDITVAATLPGAFYLNAAAFARMKERVFARTWQWLGTLESYCQIWCTRVDPAAALLSV